ncbi:chain length determinant protein [Streptomyces sp. H10-C2]|uniref:chain length determinant protein n=1 Tax=unclassified Streptomyces TaxID=2593676 RepID=UPI0024BA7FA9|nr:MULTISPECIES: chain length determinant protein [unclassified Streptomyces]MDJ0340943.1 chain length determinant protein [Streptomyces sp. PH10-H1]MDJ0369825.1 chain length determinant protein [Streptomyces sp. H10-C2]
MDLAEICRVMRRRWYVLLPGLLLTAALTAGVYLVVPVKYQSQSTVGLLNSQKATVAFDGNPFLSTQTSLTGMADSLARNLNSDASITELKARGLTGIYQAMIADNAQGPLMWLTVTGTDKAGVLASDQILTAYAAERLQQFQTQQSVAPKAMIRMTTIVPPQNPVPQTKTRLQYLIMAGLLGFVLSMAGTFFVEARLRPHKLPPSVDDDADDVADANSDEQRTTGQQAVGEPAAGQPPAGQPTAGQPAGRPAPRWSKPVEEAQPDATETEAHRFV